MTFIDRQCLHEKEFLAEETYDIKYKKVLEKIVHTIFFLKYVSGCVKTLFLR